MEIRSRRNVAEDSSASSRADTFGTHTWWLVQQGTVGSRNLVVNMGELPPGTAHQLHRHPNSEQALIVIAGRGVHLSSEGEPVEVGAGDVLYVPAGEWHGFANPFETTVTIANIYGNVGSKEEAGYELHPGPPFDIQAFNSSQNI